MERTAKLKSEIDRLREEIVCLRVKMKQLDLWAGKNIVAMQCAIIEAEHGEGYSAGIDWIFNTLQGPGILPPDSETNAQEYADRENGSLDADLNECYKFLRSRQK